MGWSETEARCKKHPDHKQSSGVCPSCLREKLSHLSAPAPTNAASSSPLSSPYSFDSSSSSSPGRRGRKVAMSAVLVGAGKSGTLIKSRSMAFLVAAEEQGKGAGKEAAKGEKGRGFWARLLVGNGRKRRGGERDLGLHSKTVRESASARWVM